MTLIKLHSSPTSKFLKDRKQAQIWRIIAYLQIETKTDTFVRPDEESLRDFFSLVQRSYIHFEVSVGDTIRCLLPVIVSRGHQL